MTGTYESEQDARLADAIRDAERWAASHGIDLELRDGTCDPPTWKLVFAAPADKVGAELRDIGRRMK